MDVLHVHPLQARALKLAALAVAGLALVVALALAGVVIWLRTYAPLDADGAFSPGPGLRAAIRPAPGSGGKQVLVPSYRAGVPFLASFTLHNGGRFAVTVEGLEPAPDEAPPSVEAVGLLTPASVATTAPVGPTQPFQPLTLASGDTAVLVARFRLACHGPAAAVSTDALRLRYRYLRWFERTQTLPLPFAVTLRCAGGPLAQP